MNSNYILISLSVKVCAFLPWPVLVWWCSWTPGSEPPCHSPVPADEKSKRCTEMEIGGPAACTRTHRIATRDACQLQREQINIWSQNQYEIRYFSLVTWLWMLRRFNRWKSQGRTDLRGAKVCRGGTPRLLGRTGSAKTSWFRKALVMWLSIDGKLVVSLSIIWRRERHSVSDDV